MSNTMSYIDAEPTAESRLIVLRRSRQGDGFTQWQVANSPGILVTDHQSSWRVTQLVIEMGPQVDEVVNCLTDFINDEKFQAKIVSRTAADDLRKWTEWHLGAISNLIEELGTLQPGSTTVKAIIVRYTINAPEARSEIHHQRRSLSAEDVRRRRNG